MIDERTISRAALALGIAIASLGASARAEEPHAERVRPRYERGKGERPVAPRPPAQEVPRELVLESAARTRPREPAPDERPPSPPPGAEPSIRREALVAARWAAEEVSRTSGFREYYRIGAYDGLHAAIDNASIGAWDFREGVRAGLRDPDALGGGAETGMRAAEDAARAAAALQVSAEFHDLAREPVYDPYAAVPAYRPDTEWTIDPELIELLRELPPSGPGARALSRALEEKGLDLPGLYASTSYRDFHDARWSDPTRAFDRWRDDRSRSAAYRGLGESDRALFAQVFHEEFARLLPEWFDAEERRGYRAGFDDGFEHGASIRQEWQFRLGYGDGFDQAAASSATANYLARYPPAYERAYRAEFDDWSTTSRVEILSLTLGDANDDGVFEPGEQIFARYEIANYGGRGGTFPLVLEGGALVQAAESSASLPPRAVQRSKQPLSATIAPTHPIRKTVALGFRIGEASRSLQMLVSRPLEFRGGATLSSVDTLGGRAVVAVHVVNRSRLALPASVEIEAGGGYAVDRRESAGSIEGGQSRSIAFELTGLRALDLLSGALATRFTATSGSTLHDELSYSFPRLALDLANRDLVAYLAALSRDAAAPASDVIQARALLMERLLVDWRAAVESDGNPYKDDAQTHGSSTTIGDLVRAHAAVKREIRNAGVFDGLGAEIQRFADTLPGAHPLLRKHLKKLAGKLR